MGGFIIKKRILISTLVILVFSIFLVGFIKVIGAKTNLKPINPSWGLGTNVTEAVSNNRDYNWYVDQFNTGEFNYMNCGPTSIEMAMRWVSKEPTITAEEIRNKYLQEERLGMMLNSISYCLTNNNITNRYLREISAQKVKNEIKAGNIIIVGVNMGYISYNVANEERAGKYFDVDFQHFVIIKGYKVVDDKLYFEIYDPNSWDTRYIDGTPVGMDRYYLADELVEAAINYLKIDLSADWMVVVEK